VEEKVAVVDIVNSRTYESLARTDNAGRCTEVAVR